MQVPEMREDQRPQGLWLKKSVASKNGYKEQKVSLVSSWPEQENCCIIENGWWKLRIKNDLEVRNSKATTIIKTLSPGQF